MPGAPKRLLLIGTPEWFFPWLFGCCNFCLSLRTTLPPQTMQSPTLQGVPQGVGPDNVDNNRPRKERPRSSSRISVDYFDPTGVERLQANLRRISTTGVPGVRDSDVTLAADHFDFEHTMRSIFEQLDESDVKTRSLGVMFRNLRVVGVGATASYQSTFGSLFNPRYIMENIKNARHPPVRDILSGFDGVVRPGEMLLVLGRPGSGCTTFLKALANRRKEFHSVEGEIHYDAFSPEQIAKHYRGDLQYCPEDDVHFPSLTVEQTLRFAAKMRAPQHRITGETREMYIKTVTDILLTVFGLNHVRNTLVGDASIRGVSGGEKKRVSITETLATRSLINSWDNSTRGLDSSTALEFSRALRIATDIARLSTIVSIYQAGESLYRVFDKVCLIYDGKMAYYGPANLARQYFMDMGYEPANRQTTSDFLVSVTDPDNRVIRAGFEPTVPRTADEFADHYRRSHIARINEEDMKSYIREFVEPSDRAAAFIASARAEHAKTTSKKSSYLISIPMQTRAVMTRRVEILRGNMAVPIINACSFIFQAVIIGTVFVQLPKATSGFFSRGGVLFFSLLFTALTGLAEIPALFGQRPIVARHQKVAMYHPFIEAAALTLVDIPITFFTLVIYTIILYFAVGLQVSAGQYFIFFLFVFLVALTLRAWFRALAAAFKDPSSANTIAGISLLAITLYTGYTIPRSSMIGALRWISHINPLRYGFESVITNEFHTLQGTCSSLVPSGPGYEGVTLQNQVCTVLGSVSGQAIVNGNTYVGLSFGYSFSHLWMNFGIILAFFFGFLALYLFLTEINVGISEVRPIILFKRGAKATVTADVSDEEKAGNAINDSGAIVTDSSLNSMDTEKPPKMTNIFSWQHITYTVASGGHKLHLLNDVSGYVPPGKLTALMGESGAGKTTLLNVLASRTDTGVIAGDRFVNGQTLPTDFQAQTGYCQQSDTHVPKATVREAILLSATLRQPQSVPITEKQTYVETCIVMCGLQKYADAIVGSLGVEHRKRLTIAVELAAKPKLLLFLDEPTSGLDSQSAWAIMVFLRSLADNGQAILCTIHQPSAELFQVFDKLLLLRKGGETVYLGDLGRNSTTMIGYFEKNGGRPCEPEENPAEYMLEVIGAGASATSSIDWHHIWRHSPECDKTAAEIEHIHAEGRTHPPINATFHSEFSTSWIHQMVTLLIRDFQVHWRDTFYLIAKFGLNIIAGLFIGFTFWKSKDTIQGSQNKLFAVFMALIISVPLANQIQIPFIDMRNVFEIRERPSRMYSWTALIASQILAELPFNVIGSSLFFFCWYWTVGFHSDRAGFSYLMLCVIYPVYYTTIGQAIAAMSPNASVAALLFSVLFSFVITFNGVLQPFNALGWWKWMNHVSPYTYLIEALLGQAIGKQEINCSSVELVTVNPPSGSTCSEYLSLFISRAGGFLTNPNATSACNYCNFRTTDEFMGAKFNIRYSHHWRDAGIFIAFTAFNIAAIFTLTYLFRIRTWNFPKLPRRSQRPE